jgi:hypothetical protein
MIRSSFRSLILLVALSSAAGLAAAQNRNCPRANSPEGNQCPTACPRASQGQRPYARGGRGPMASRPGRCPRTGIRGIPGRG